MIFGCLPFGTKVGYGTSAHIFRASAQYHVTSIIPVDLPALKSNHLYCEMLTREIFNLYGLFTHTPVQSCTHPIFRPTSQHLRHVFVRAVVPASCAVTMRSMECQAVPMISSRTKWSEISGGSRDSLWVAVVLQFYSQTDYLRYSACSLHKEQSGQLLCNALYIDTISSCDN